MAVITWNWLGETQPYPTEIRDTNAAARSLPDELSRSSQNCGPDISNSLDTETKRKGKRRKMKLQKLTLLRSGTTLKNPSVT